MMRAIKQLALVALIGLGGGAGVQAFSLLGPYKGWQTGDLGYGLPGDIGGPMTLFEEYRWNITNVYYAVDSSFLNYFGTRGAEEVDKAFAILNAIPPASAMSPDLREFPQTDVLRENYRAGALGILDVRSTVLGIMIEQMGLTDPIRYTWTLRGRNTQTFGGVTWTNYSVVKLNYDPVSYAPSSYVNGSLLGYNIREPIQVTGIPDYADAVERSLDTVPFANGDPTPVSSQATFAGQYWLGLSRDDAGGLRWLLRTNNYNTETILPGSLVAVTNQVELILTNRDLRSFIRETSETLNDTAAILTNYPNLLISGTNRQIQVNWYTNQVWVVTNSTASPTGHLQYVETRYTNYFETNFTYTFENIVTNGPGVGDGGFYIVPPNLLGYQVLRTVWTNVEPVTNLVYDSINYYQLNTNTQLLLTNYDLTLFSLRSVNTTNDAPTLQAFYPDLVITNTNSYYSIIVSTNLVSFFTNAPFNPQQITLTNIVTNAIPRYNYAYANLFTNVLLSEFLDPSTNVFILPTNYVGYQLVSNLFFQTVTNVVTNTLPGFGVVVDYQQPVPVFTTNLALFREQSRTNSAEGLLALYPDLIVTNTAYTIGVEALTNYFFYLTNPPFAPAGTQLPVFYPEVTNVLVTNYIHSFANVVTNTYVTNSPLYLAREEVYKPPFAPAGSVLLRTNWVLTEQRQITNGSIYIIPTNMVGLQLIQTLLTNVVAMTNILQPSFSTNFAGTNVAATNLTGTNIVYTNTYLLSYGTDYVFSAYPILPDPGTNYVNLYTNHFTAIYGVELMTNGTNSGVEISSYTNLISVVYPIEFQSPTNSVGIRPGVDKVNFINVTRNFDSMIGQFFTPITNQFVENVITNSQMRSQVVRRILGAPDILFVSEDLGLRQGLVPWYWWRNTTTNWINNDAINGSSAQGGPGVIAPPIRISLTDQLPYYLNQTPFFLNETYQSSSAVWGSYDGSTNTPVIYPDYESIQDHEREILNPTQTPP